MNNERYSTAAALAPAPGTSPIRVSMIIEWKNQDLAADERADAMLAALARQWPVSAGAGTAGHPQLAAAALSPALEILFVYDGAAAKRNLGGSSPGVSLPRRVSWHRG
ncbi:hypothetical protein [uncultured Thiohalocapsa sp.]|uniref:hypothetical protein n=1 Tax=uncultured Thiohalocapsa sp. TaxID=768990 RepID=UPI0025E0F046|nr:hypothetical protein [uncultured Thiohalocapsa sp.]